MYAGSGHLYMLPVGKAGDFIASLSPARRDAATGASAAHPWSGGPAPADPRRGPHARASPRTAPATGGCHTTEQSAPAAGWAVWPWRAQGDQDAGGVEDQSAALSQQPGSLGYPASRIAPQAGAALGDGQVEAARGQRDVCVVSLDERERKCRTGLDSCRADLSWAESHPPGSAGRTMRRSAPSAAELDDI